MLTVPTCSSSEITAVVVKDSENLGTFGGRRYTSVRADLAALKRILESGRPHTAGASQLRGPRNIRRFCENLRRAQTGDALLGVVDKELGY